MAFSTYVLNCNAVVLIVLYSDVRSTMYGCYMGKPTLIQYILYRATIVITAIPTQSNTQLLMNPFFLKTYNDTLERPG